MDPTVRVSVLLNLCAVTRAIGSISWALAFQARRSMSASTAAAVGRAPYSKLPSRATPMAPVL